jgi:hypothetical protein
VPLGKKKSPQNVNLLNPPSKPPLALQVVKAPDLHLQNLCFAAVHLDLHQNFLYMTTRVQHHDVLSNEYGIPRSTAFRETNI